MHHIAEKGNRFVRWCARYWFLAFIVVAAAVHVGPTVFHKITGPSHEFVPSPEFVAYAKQRPEQIARGFESMRKRPSVDQVLRARRSIIQLRTMIPAEEITQGNEIARVIDRGNEGLSEQESLVYRSMVNSGAMAQDHSVDFETSVAAACMDQHGGSSGCMLSRALQPPQRSTMDTGAIEFAASLFGVLMWLYLLAIPFAATGLWAALVIRGHSMGEFAREHLGDYVLSAALWPIAYIASDFPFWTPWTHLRSRVAARIAELGGGQLPVWRQAIACVAVVFGMVFASVVPVRPVYAQQAHIQWHGFLDASADHKGGAHLNHAWLQAVGTVADGAKVDIIVDPAPKALPLRQATATFALSDSSGIRVGQMATSIAFMFDSPASDRIGGGAWAAGTYASFFDLGVEGFAKFGNVTTRASVLSGSGPNKADANKSKDGMLGVSWRPGGGAHVLEATVQGGEQPEGWRTRALGHGRFAFTRAFLDFTGGFQQVQGSLGWGLSSLVVAPVHAHAEISVAYDALQLPGSLAIEHVMREQVTLVGFSQSLRAAIMMRWSSATGWLGDVRMQFVF